MRRITIAAAALLCGVQANAGTITQTVNFHFADHGTTFTDFNQFNPSLGPLNAVEFSIWTAPYLGIGPSFAVTNPTTSTLTVNETITQIIDTDAGFQVLSVTKPFTLTPGGNAGFFLPVSYSNSAVVTTNLSHFIGTGGFGPGFYVNAIAKTDNPLVTVSNMGGMFVDGTEKMTYYFGDSFAVPEPASALMLSLGLAAVSCLAWRHWAA